MQEKNILTLSVADYIVLFDKESARLNLPQNKSTNTASLKSKIARVRSMLENAPADLVMTVEGCRNDDARGYQFPNVGSIIECLVKYWFTKQSQVCKTWDTEAVDFRNGCVNWEVKASIDCKSKATPSDAEATLLINERGAWMIRKADVLNFVDKQGRLGSKLEAGKRVEWLSERLGLNGDDNGEA